MLVQRTVPIRSIHCHSNTIPWLTKDVKTILNAKKKAFRAGNKKDLRTILGDLELKFKES